jgi:hypothetical protein
MPVAIHFNPDKLIPSRTGDLILQTENLNSICLTKGLNFYEEHQVESIKEHPSYIEYTKIGAIQLVEESPQEPVLLIKARNSKDAVVLVKTCHDIEQLKAWQQEETEGQGRTTILTAIEDRLNLLESERLTKATILI